jgi:hypothetical protein
MLLPGVGVSLLYWPVARIDQSTCDQIQPGMTVSEVEAIIGGPNGWYDGVQAIDTALPDMWPTFHREMQRDYLFWIGSQGELIVRQDAQGRVAEAAFHPRKILSHDLDDERKERLSRNLFRENPFCVNAAYGASISLWFVAGPLVLVLVALQMSTTERGPGVLLFCGTIICLLFILLATLLLATLLSGTPRITLYEVRWFGFQLGAWVTALVLFGAATLFAPRGRAMGQRPKSAHALFDIPSSAFQLFRQGSEAVGDSNDHFGKAQGA